MFTKKTNFKKSLSKTLIIVFGVIIAILMSLTSPLFAADNLITDSGKSIMEPVAVDQSETNTKEAKDENLKLHSTALLFQIFTKNLPFLNAK